MSASLRIALDPEQLEAILVFEEQALLHVQRIADGIDGENNNTTCLRQGFRISILLTLAAICDPAISDKKEI